MSADTNTQRARLCRLERVCNAILMAVIIGFFIFYAFIGGSAISGCVEDSRYYVADHGTLTEVSETVWYISLAWGYSFFIIFLADIVLNVWINSVKQKNRWEEKP